MARILDKSDLATFELQSRLYWEMGKFICGKVPKALHPIVGGTAAHGNASASVIQASSKLPKRTGVLELRDES